MVIEAHDGNASLRRICPPNLLLGQACLLISGELDIFLETFRHRP